MFVLLFCLQRALVKPNIHLVLRVSTDINDGEFLFDQNLRNYFRTGYCAARTSSGSGR